MAKRKKATVKPSLTGITAKWRRQYESATELSRISVVYGISKEADKLQQQHGVAQVQNAISEATQKKGKERAEILRLASCFTRSQVDRAASELSKNPGAISLSHFMTLTHVKDKSERARLLGDCFTKGWSHSVLRDHAKGKSKQHVVIRPKQLADSISLHAGNLAKELDSVRQTVFLGGIERVKKRDRVAARDSFQKADKSLKELGALLKNASKQLGKAASVMEGLIESQQK